MLAGIREVLIINTPHEQALFKRLLGDGSQWGMRIEYAVQPQPGRPGAGLPDRSRVRRRRSPAAWCSATTSSTARASPTLLQARGRARSRRDRVRLLGARPGALRRGRIRCRRAGDRPGRKTGRAASNYAVTGLYFYDGRASDFAAGLKPSPRGELEITDLNRCYLDDGSLHLEKLGRGYAWLDTGTHESLIAGLQLHRDDRGPAGPAGLLSGGNRLLQWLDRLPTSCAPSRAPLAKNGYGQYLLGLLEHGQVE